MPYKTLYKGRPIANGLAFASEYGEVIPPSLSWIHAELNYDVFLQGFNTEILELGREMLWGFRQANQGVLLLNQALTTTVKGESHKELWVNFITPVLEYLNNKPNLTWLVFTDDFTYLNQINEDHLVINLGNPNPQNLGNRPFSRVNSYLKKHDQTEIKWW